LYRAHRRLGQMAVESLFSSDLPTVLEVTLIVPSA
jgi:hypothetical protein